MLVAFGENGIKTLEDLADCATDDLVGWTERKKEKDAEAVRHKGVLDGFEIGRKEAEDMIMAARVARRLDQGRRPARRCEAEAGAEEPAEGGEGAAAEAAMRRRRRLDGDGAGARNIGWALSSSWTPDDADADGARSAAVRRLARRAAARRADPLRRRARRHHRSRSGAPPARARRVGDGQTVGRRSGRQGKAFARSLKRQVKVSPDLPELIEHYW